MPAVTVVTCTFGRPEMLLRAIESVEAQTFRDFTHLIVEDFGNVPSIKDMGLKGPTLMTMGYRTGWPGFVCRNKAVIAAQTELVAFLDDDNWYEPEHLETLVDLQASTGADFVWSSTMLWSKQGEVIGYRRSTKPPGPDSIDISEILCKRALFVGSGGLDPRNGPRGDGVLAEQWMRMGARYAHSDEVTLNYTVNDPVNEKFIKNGCIRDQEGYSLV